MLELVLRLWLYGCRHQYVPSDINAPNIVAAGSSLDSCSWTRRRRLFVGVSVSDVINFRLEQVIIPSGFLFRSSLRCVSVDFYQNPS